MPLGPSIVCTQSPDGARPASTRITIERFSRTACSGDNGSCGNRADRREMVKPDRPKLSTRPPSSSLTYLDRAVVVAVERVRERLEHRRRVGIGVRLLQPIRRLVGALLRIGLDHHRREHDRHRRRGRDRVRDRIGREIAAQRDERRLAVDEWRAVVDVGGVDPDPRARRLAEVGERRAVEQVVVQPVCENVLHVVDAAAERLDQAERIDAGVEPSSALRIRNFSRKSASASRFFSP